MANLPPHIYFELFFKIVEDQNLELDMENANC